MLTIKNITAYDSIESWQAAADKRPHIYSDTSSHTGTDEGHKKGFFMTASKAEADEILKHGYADGAAMIQRARLALPEFRGMASHRTMKLAPAGILPSVAAVTSGQPFTMYAPRRAVRSAPVLDVIAHRGAIGDATTKEIINRGVAILNLIDAIQATGTRVALWVCFYNQFSSGMRIGNVVQVKRPEQPYSLLSLAYPMIHPSFQRRHNWHWLERHVSASESSGYGSPVNLAAYEIPANTLYIPHVSTGGYNFKTPKAAEAQIRDVFQKFLATRSKTERNHWDVF